MLIWLDLETTGLNPETDKILSIASVITDVDLNITAIHSDLIIHQSDEVLNNMNDWCIKQHNKSGLTAQVKESGFNVIDVERLIIAFLQAHIKPNASPMCGNSISQDRRFIRKYMPELHKYFTYQHIDVTTTKLLFEMWYPNMPRYNKKSSHLALDDVFESIEELRYYRKYLFK